MSNCIQVGTKCYPFRWEGLRLLAFVGGRWVEVQRSSHKNERGEWIFMVKGGER